MEQIKPKYRIYKGENFEGKVFYMFILLPEKIINNIGYICYENKIENNQYFENKIPKKERTTMFIVGLVTLIFCVILISLCILKMK